MDLEIIINNWIEVSNNFDTIKYLNFYDLDAVLDDPSVGRKFIGHGEIKEYFESYFIGYNTKTKIIKLEVQDKNNAHLEVEFTGDFPEKRLGGMFDFTFKNSKIVELKANLI
jgi:ketosteroid isomerase-like protein